MRPHHVSLGAGMSWSGGYGVGDANAQLRGNGPGASATPFNWFTTEARMTTVSAPEFHIGFAVTPRVAIEGGIGYARPRISVAISGDAEAPSQELAGEEIQQVQIGAGVSWQLPVSMGWRVAPFVSAGGAWLRQLHEDRGLAETGQIFHAGAGARYYLKVGQGSSNDLGLRIDARVNFRSNGIDFENANRTYPSVSLMLFVGL